MHLYIYPSLAKNMSTFLLSVTHDTDHDFSSNPGPFPVEISYSRLMDVKSDTNTANSMKIIRETVRAQLEKLKGTVELTDVVPRTPIEANFLAATAIPDSHLLSLQWQLQRTLLM
jgi:hypothetical protein